MTHPTSQSAGEERAQPRLLDLYAGAGGCSVGYARAGFEVVGADLAPQPNYPFEFWQADALEVLEAGKVAHHLVEDFDAIHASPPCQHDANVTRWRGNPDDHPDLIPPTLELLDELELPYVVEAVNTKKLRGDHMLCGTMFGLRVRRHRFFQTNWPWFMAPSSCRHRSDDCSFDHGAKQPESVYRDAMDCGWMTVLESREAIPPAYCQHLGEYLLKEVRRRASQLAA